MISIVDKAAKQLLYYALI